MTKNLSIESFNSLRSFLSLSKKKSSLSLLHKSSVYFRECFPLSYPLSFQHRSLSLSCIDRDCDSNIERRCRDISRNRLWNSSLISGPTSRSFIGENQRMNTKKKGITYMLSYRSFSKKNKGGKNKGKGESERSENNNNNNNNDNNNSNSSFDIKDIQQRMKTTIQYFEKEISGLRSGRPEPSMFDSIQVQIPGESSLSIVEIGQVSIKNPTMAQITPYDPTLAKYIIDSLRSSSLELNPQLQGNIVQIPLPKPSTEMRENLVKTAGILAEKTKVSIRNIRRDSMDKLKKLEKNKTSGISEDDIRRDSKKVENLTEEMIAKVTQLVEAKKKQILT